MNIGRYRIPKDLLIAVAVCLVLGLIAGPLINARYTEEELAANVLLAAIPFVLIFASILLVYIGVIDTVTKGLNATVAARTHGTVEKIIMAGIGLGIIGMFQPWEQWIYKRGFTLLLISTLTYILWSHISPKGEMEGEA